MSNIHYYELCFYHDEDDDMATQGRCSYCIKTEIPPVITDEAALEILFGNNPSEQEKILMNHLTCVMEISEAEAYSYFDMKDIINRREGKHGVFYSR